MMRRRELLAAAALAASTLRAQTARKGRLKQCVTRAAFGREMPFEESCKLASQAGCFGYDLIGPKDWPTLKKYGLLPTMYPPCPGGTIPDAMNPKENHSALTK